MTTTNPTMEELKFLCIQVDRLVLVADHLRGIYQVKGHLLDKQIDKLPAGANNSVIGVQAQMLPEEIWRIRPFAIRETRQAAFDSLFEQVDQVVTITARAIGQIKIAIISDSIKINYDLLVADEDKVGDAANVQAINTEITDLLQLIHQLKELLK